MHRGVLYLLAGLFVMGCGGSKTGTTPKDTSDLPDFVLNPPKQAGVLFGTGVAEQQSPQLAKETADLRARKEIASVLSQKVSILLKDYLRQAGVGSAAEVTELAQSVIRAISDVELVGVVIEKHENINGKMYSLAKFPLDDSMKKQVNDAVNKSLSSKEALLNQFREKRGFEELDKQLEKMKVSEQ
jgi:hypothetical protein